MRHNSLLPWFSSTEIQVGWEEASLALVCRTITLAVRLACKTRPMLKWTIQNSRKFLKICIRTQSNGSISNWSILNEISTDQQAVQRHLVKLEAQVLIWTAQSNWSVSSQAAAQLMDLSSQKDSHRPCKSSARCPQTGMRSRSASLSQSRNSPKEAIINVLTQLNFHKRHK